MSSFIQSVLPETVISDGMRISESRTARINAAAFKRALGSVSTSTVKHAEQTTGTLRVANGNNQMPVSYIDDRYFICSIYPLTLRRERPQGDVRNGGRGISIYNIPGVRRGEYTLIEVAPAVAWLQDWTGGIDNPPGSPRPTIVPGYNVATSLVSFWRSGSVINVGAIGVDIVPQGVEEGTPEFLDFLARLTQLQETNFQFVVDEAEAAFKSGKPIHNLDRAMTSAAWLYGDGATKFEWFGRQRFTQHKSCPACQADMPKNAIVCGKCNTNLLNFFRDMGVDAQGSDDVVYLYQTCIANYKRVPTSEMVEMVLTGKDVVDVAAIMEPKKTLVKK